MNKVLFQTLCLFAAVTFFTSCTTLSRGMREANTRVNLEKSDFTLSEQVSGTATQTKIIGIDFERILKKSVGSIDNSAAGGGAGITGFLLPMVGAYLPNPNRVDFFALYDLYEKNPGYDVLFYPTFERNRFSLLGLYTKTDVKVTARLAKLNK